MVLTSATVDDATGDVDLVTIFGGGGGGGGAEVEMEAEDEVDMEEGRDGLVAAAL